jgi:hypothetical protein
MAKAAKAPAICWLAKVLLLLRAVEVRDEQALLFPINRRRAILGRKGLCVEDF